MNFKNRQHLLGLLAGAAVVLLAGDRLVLTPLTNSWKARSARVAELKKQYSQGQTILERESSVRSRWKTMQTNSFSGETSVAENQLLKAFDRWSQASRVSISSIKPQWKQHEEDHALLECRVDASGGLSDLARFIYEIEKDPLALKLENVELTTRDENGQQLTLGLHVSGFLLTSSRP
jgi:Tfp pilus assembly protein PilO